MSRLRVPTPVHDLGPAERAALNEYGRLLARDPRAASFASVAAALGKDYSTIKNQLESARKKFGVRTSYGAYLIMLRREGRLRSHERDD